MSTLATTKYYAAWQMWLDGGISADYWLPFEKGQNVIEIDDILEKYAQMYAYGLKSHYYTVPKTQKSNQEKNDVMEKVLNRGVIHDAGHIEVPADFFPSAPSTSPELDETDDRSYDGIACASGVCTL